jgi:hypothetical protein
MSEFRIGTLFYYQGYKFDVCLITDLDNQLKVFTFKNLTAEPIGQTYRTNLSDKPIGTN